MRYFQDLGQRIAGEWLKANYDPEYLPAIAAEALAASRPSDHVDYVELIEWLQETRIFPQQFLQAFGQPSVTLFHHARFFIEALFWHSGTTAIHEHRFSGAFSVLHGSSLQRRYDFRAKDRVNGQIALGDVVLRDVKLLATGDVEQIIGGPRLIHSVFHLDSPSVTVVVRTHIDAGNRPQFNYYPPFLALDPFYDDPPMMKRVQTLILLLRANPSRFKDVAARSLRESDFHLAMTILKLARCTGECSTSPTCGVESYEELFSIARERHGPRMELVRAAQEAEIRDVIITSRREKVTDADHRFFLAMLLLPDIQSIRAAVAHRYPGADPHAKILDWLKELAPQEIGGITFDDFNTELGGHLMFGRSTPEILEALAAEYDPAELQETRAKLEQHLERMRGDVVFRSLFTHTTEPLQVRFLHGRDR